MLSLAAAQRLVPLRAQRSDRSRRIGVAEGLFTVPDDIDKSGPDLAEFFHLG